MRSARYYEKVALQAESEGRWAAARDAWAESSRIYARRAVVLAWVSFALGVVAVVWSVIG